MKYTATIQEITDPTARAIKLGYGDESKSDLFIFDMTITYSYLDFSTPGMMTIVGFEYVSPNTGTLTPVDAIQSGNLIQIFENENLIFIGYILEIEEEYVNPGRMLHITFDSLLSQFTRQSAIQTNEQVATSLQPPVTVTVQTLQPHSVEVANTDFFSNKAPLQDLVNFLMEQSIYLYAQKFAQFQVFYEKPDILSPVDLVWYYASTQSTKEQVLRNAVYFYQQIIYQDPQGNLIFTLPSENDTSSYNIADGDLTLRNYRKVSREAMLPNNVVYSLIYMGFFPPTGGQVPSNLVSQSVPDPKYFKRSYDLFKSGYFSQVQLTVNSLSSDIITNPVLLNLLNRVDYIIPQNGDRTQETMAPLLSARTLAENLTSSINVQVELERNVNNIEIPIGKTFNLNNKPYFCIYAEISISADMSGQNVKNTIKLTGAPLKSITGIWSTQPFS